MPQLETVHKIKIGIVITLLVFSVLHPLFYLIFPKTSHVGILGINAIYSGGMTIVLGLIQFVCSRFYLKKTEKISMYKIIPYVVSALMFLFFTSRIIFDSSWQLRILSSFLADVMDGWGRIIFMLYVIPSLLAMANILSWNVVVAMLEKLKPKARGGFGETP